MAKSTRNVLLVAATLSIGTMIGPKLIQNTHADQPQPLGVQERLTSLEHRVATLENEVDRLKKINSSGKSDSASVAKEAMRVKPAPEVKITPIDKVGRGQQVVLRGEVERIRDEDEFILRDRTGSIEIYIGWQNKMLVRLGDMVTVYGIADDDALPGTRPDIYARRIVLPDGITHKMRLDE